MQNRKAADVGCLRRRVVTPLYTTGFTARASVRVVAVRNVCRDWRRGVARNAISALRAGFPTVQLTLYSSAFYNSLLVFGRWIASTSKRKFAAPYVQLVFGARQTGKSTLLRELLPEAVARHGYVICRCATPLEIADGVTALPWSHL